MVKRKPRNWRAEPRVHEGTKRPAGLPTRLHAARIAAGKTQQQLAADLGVPRSSVWNWESGTTAPRGPNLVAVRAFIAKHSG